MESIIIDIFNTINIKCDSFLDLNGKLIPREVFLSNASYDDVLPKITELKKYLSSSYLTSLQKSAKNTQKWPILNLIRQILKTYKYDMKPIRKCDGYSLDGKKKFKRFFLISKQN